MASIKKKKNCKNWFARFSDINGKPVEKTTKIADCGTPKERADAKRRARRVADIMERIALGETRTEAHLRECLFEIYELVNNDRIFRPSIEKFFREFLKEFEGKADVGDRATSTYIRYSGAVDRLMEILGEERIQAPFDTLREEDFEKFLLKRLEESDINTVINDFKVFKVPLQRAVRKGLLKSNPAAAVDLEKSASAERIPFTIEEFQQLILACRDQKLHIAGDPREMEGMIWAGLYTALRLGDIASLRWSDIDFENGVIRLTPRKTRRKNKHLEIPIAKALEAALKKLPSFGTDSEYLFPSMQPDTPRRKETNDFSFLSKRFNCVVDHAGIDPLPMEDQKTGRTTRQKTFHCLRYTFNSMLAEAGVPQELRMKLTGHASKRVNDGYTKFSIESKRDAINLLPNLDLPED
jgi:integrase